MNEYAHEPIRGLPGDLPAGERILWQGGPDWRAFARHALHAPWIAGYFAILAIIAAVEGTSFGIGIAIVAGVVVLGLLNLFALLVARTTVYTITNKRVILRIGIALNACINLPLKKIGSADLRAYRGGGDIALTLTERGRLGYAMLWPHARPFRFGSPQPMLRAIPNADAVATLLACACADVAPTKAPSEVVEPAVATRPLREAAA